MQPSDAASIINRVAPRPGYRHEAFDYSHRQQGHVVVRISQDPVRDSSDYVGTDYPTVIPGGLVSDFAVYVGDAIDHEDLVYALVGAYLRWDAHELREFLRIDGWAPLHPHRHAGQQAWAVRAGADSPQAVDLSVAQDVAYGVRRSAR